MFLLKKLRRLLQVQMMIKEFYKKLQLFRTSKTLVSEKEEIKGSNNKTV